MDLDVHLKQINREVSGLLNHPYRTLYEPAEYLLKLGGKRIRPLLCVLGGSLYERLHSDLYKIAAAIEVFHNFTLVHDDIMDQAPLRRGKPTVHHQFGTAQAILSGDVMLIEAFQSMQNLEKKDALIPMLNVFTTLCREVCLGQQLDFDFEKRKEIALPEYLEMIRLKTAVLLGGSLQLGALYAHASSQDVETLYKAGEALGVVFQIQDDYLDAFGGDGFGKKTGGDILASKKTYLFVKALELLPVDEKKNFITAYTSSSEDKLDQVMAVFNHLNLKDVIKADIEARYQDAIVPLRNLVGEEDSKQALIQLIEGLFHRKI